MDVRSDLERFMMSELARSTAEANYAKNPFDADNLTKWGAALMELSQMGDIRDSKRMIKDAISKFEEALGMNPAMPETLWHLGNAHTLHAFFTPDNNEAQSSFESAFLCFHKAVNEDPGNRLYVNSLQAASQAPELRKEIHKHGFGQQNMNGGSSASLNEKSSLKRYKKKDNSELKYDIFGWIILAVGIIAWVGTAKSHVPPPPSK